MNQRAHEHGFPSRKRLLVGAAILIGLVGCSSSGSPDSSDDGALTSGHAANNGFDSVVPGNSIAVDIAAPGSSAPSEQNCNASQTELDILYADNSTFFGGASTISVWSRTTDESGHQTTVTDSAKLASGVYVVSHCLDASAKESSIELAFSDDGKHKWDSNSSKNYLVNLKASGGSSNGGSSGNTSMSDPHGEMDTDEGAHVTVDISLHPSGSSNCGSAQLLQVVYEDNHDFFGEQSSLNMFAETHSDSEGTKDGTFALRAMGGHPAKYQTVRLCINWDARSTELDLAFSDTGKHQWDSNGGHNYSFKFH